MIQFLTRLDPLVRTADGRHVTLQELVLIQRDDGAMFRIPAGAQSDGASTPSMMWAVLPPFGAYWLAAVVHDCAYRGTLERQTVDGQWFPANLPKDQCDWLFHDCMLALGVSLEVRDALYEGVAKFGWKAFREDRQ